MNIGYKFFNGKIEYTVLHYTGNEQSNLALLKRDTYCPYVVAINIRAEKDGTFTWAFGHYFNKKANALSEFYEQRRKL